ncbi:hypothetical protein L6R46_04015 [Myxococcota bacterium]|nr:hypothetical protein [Myxococcota bacterium]
MTPVDLLETLEHCAGSLWGAFVLEVQLLGVQLLPTLVLAVIGLLWPLRLVKAARDGRPPPPRRWGAVGLALIVLAVWSLIHFAVVEEATLYSANTDDRTSLQAQMLAYAMRLLSRITLLSALVSAWATFWATRLWFTAEGEQRLILGRGVAQAALICGFGLVLMGCAQQLREVYAGIVEASLRDPRPLAALPKALWTVGGVWATACGLGVIGLAASGAGRAELSRFLGLLGLINLGLGLGLAWFNGVFNPPHWLQDLLS